MFAIDQKGSENNTVVLERDDYAGVPEWGREPDEFRPVPFAFGDNGGGAPPRPIVRDESKGKGKRGKDFDEDKGKGKGKDFNDDRRKGKGKDLTKIKVEARERAKEATTRTGRERTARAILAGVTMGILEIGVIRTGSRKERGAPDPDLAQAGVPAAAHGGRRRIPGRKRIIGIIGIKRITGRRRILGRKRILEATTTVQSHGAHRTRRGRRAPRTRRTPGAQARGASGRRAAARGPRRSPPT